MLWSLAVIVVGVYCGLGIVLFLSQERLVFIPSLDLDGLPSDEGLAYEDVGIVTSDGLRLHAWFLPAPGPARATVLFCHGNAGNISHRIDTARIFLELGLNVLLFDYRGYGKSEGKVSERGVYLDAEAAWRWLVETRKIAPADILVVGRSLGGAPAARLAGTIIPAPRALILESAFSSIPDMAAARYPIYPKILSRIQLSTKEFVRDVRCPVLVLHSREDEVVPYRLGRQLFELANEPKTFGELRGDHNGCYFLDEPNYRRILAEFLSAAPRQLVQPPRAIPRSDVDGGTAGR